MKVLFDTHLLLWAAYEPHKLSRPAQDMLLGAAPRMFSAASIWEVSIKTSLGRDDFTVDARVLRRGLLDNGYVELAVTGAHAAAISDLPPLHADPFDRMLVAQARVEGVVLATADHRVAAYGSPVRSV